MVASTESRATQVLLLDADGVLQHARHEWAKALDGIAGEGFATAVFTREGAALRGEATMRACLQHALRDVGAHVDVDDVLDLWRALDLDAAALEVVARARRAGARAHLVTNQQDVRAEFMRPLYEDHVDELFFSCEVGAAKPDVLFFERVLSRLRVPAHACLFVDDSRANVTSAQRLGVPSLVHDPSSGAAGLEAALVARGVRLAG